MDPASAIGVASSVLAFLDFSIKVVNGAVEIYRSADGTTSENAHLEIVAQDMKARTESMKQHSTAKTPEELKIVKLADECHKISGRMLDLLEKTKVKGGKRSTLGSLQAAYQARMKRKDVAELKSLIQEYRAQILLNLQNVLQDGQSTILSDLRDIKTECEGMRTGFAEQIDGLRANVLQIIMASQKNVHQDDSSGEFSLGTISRKITEMQSAVADVPIHHRILRHLVFDSMTARQSQIHVAEPDTCGWILDDAFADNGLDELELEELQIRDSYWADIKQLQITQEISDRKQTCQQVLNWLQAGESILHISGNAGSGKSTLMKFLHGHSRAKKELLIWAGNKKLVIGQFFFWNAGNAPQRTLVGLYKSLLFQALSQCPELIELVFPSQVSRMKIRRGSKVVEAVENFSDEHIREAFNLLISRTSFNTHRFCFFIDGLDECDGNRLDHERLAASLKSWTTGGDVKLCVSSRPWAEFSKAFDSMNSLTLHLHLLNGFDIETYCFGQLMKDDEAGQDPDLCRDLGETIVSNASGIFLWAHLVTDVVLEGIRQGDPAGVLRAKIKEMPPQLKDLYKKLREPVEKSKQNKARSDRMLLLAAKHVTIRYPDLNAMAFSWLDHADGELGLLDLAFPPASEYQPYSEDEIAARLKRVAQQVNGLARGLLELVKGDDHPAKYQGLNKSFWSTRIQFCHRSARDYLLEEIGNTLNPDFPNFDSVYERLYIAELIYGKDLEVPFDDHTFFHFGHPGFEDAGPEILGRLEVTLRPELVPRWWSIEFMEPGPKEGSVSFLHYITYWGCLGFGRAMLERELEARDQNACSPTSIILSGPNTRTSLLVAILLDYSERLYLRLRKSLKLGLELVCRRVELDVLVDVISDGVPTKLPAWLIAFMRAADEILPIVDSSYDLSGKEYWLKLLGELHMYSLDIGQALTLKVAVQFPTLEVDYSAFFSWRVPESPYEVFNINSQDFIRLMSPPEDAIAGEKTSLLPWVEALDAQDFLRLASQWRWRHPSRRPHFEDSPYDTAAGPFVLLAIEWGKNHLGLRHPERIDWTSTNTLLNFRIY